MEVILIKYGLVAFFLAAAVEADVIPVLAGVAAHRGYFNPVLLVGVASAGALAGDCVWFYLGRHLRNNKLFLRLRPKAELLFHRVGHWQIPASHVIYGTRVATMTFLGARGSPFRKFALVDGASCLTLTTVLFSLGFALSASVSMVQVYVKRVEIVLLAVVVLCVLFIFLLQKLGLRVLAGPATGEHAS